MTKCGNRCVEVPVTRSAGRYVCRLEEVEAFKEKVPVPLFSLPQSYPLFHGSMPVFLPKSVALLSFESVQ